MCGGGDSSADAVPWPLISGEEVEDAVAKASVSVGLTVEKFVKIWRDLHLNGLFHFFFLDVYCCN